jgi:hypothetical protein
MRQLVQPGPRSFDWRVGEQRLEGLSSTRIDDRESRMNLRDTLLSRDLLSAHPEQVVYMTCNEAFFVDLVSNPHHRARVHRLGLAHPDRVFSLLGLVLHPSDLVRQAAWQVVGRSREGGCGILALQVRKGTPETSAYSHTQFWTPRTSKPILAGCAEGGGLDAILAARLAVR